MNNTELAEALAADHGLTKADARKYVDGIFSAIAGAAAKGEEVSLNGFGKFKVKDQPAREGRNPSTGAAIQIAGCGQGREGPVERLKTILAAAFGRRSSLRRNMIGSFWSRMADRIFLL